MAYFSSVVDNVWVPRDAELTDAQWERIRPLLPSSAGRRGRPFRDDRLVVEGIVWRYRVGSPWRDVPASFGPWQTLWKRHRRYSGDGTWDRIHAELLTEADAAGVIDWAVSVDSMINRARQHATNLPRATGGPVELQESPPEPADHGIGRSRGGLSTKIHQLVDGRGLPLVVVVGPGQAGDAPMFPVLKGHLRVGRRGPGRPRSRSDRIRGDKAYSSRAIRAHLRQRGIIAVIPEPAAQAGHRRRRGSRGGRPVGYDVVGYRGRNGATSAFSMSRTWVRRLVDACCCRPCRAW